MLKKLNNTDIFSMIILVLLTGLVIYGLIMQVGSITGISPSTKNRTKPDTVIAPDEVYYDISSEWTENTEFVDVIMPAFAENTGVLPYLKVLPYNKFNDQEKLDAYAEQLNQELFQDEDHFLFVFAPQSENEYLSACVIGKTASAVMDEEAVTIFHQYLKKYTETPGYDHADLFLRVYRDTYERIMGIINDTLGIIYTVLMSVLVILLIFLMIKRAKKVFRRAG